MGRLKSYIEDFMDEIGYKKGYTWDNLPSISKMSRLLTNKRKKETSNGNL